MKTISRRTNILVALILAAHLIPAAGTMLSVDIYASGVDVYGLEKVWNYTKEDSEATFWKLDWSPDGNMVAATFFDSKCVVLNASDGSVVKNVNRIRLTFFL